MIHRCQNCGEKLQADSGSCPKCGSQVRVMSHQPQDDNLRDANERSDLERRLRGDWNDSERKKVNSVIGTILLLAFCIAAGYITTAVLVARGNIMPEYLAITDGWIINTWGILILITLFVTVSVFGVVAAFKYLIGK